MRRLLLAPLICSSMMNASVLEDRCKDKLLSYLPKGHVIMDNTAFHKKLTYRNLAGKYSQTLTFLPPYSHLTPIPWSTRGAI